MKIFNTLLLTSMALVAGLNSETEIQEDKDNYYFIEAQCQECAIGTNVLKQDFYVITESILKSEGPIDVDTLAEDFKKVLTDKFKNGDQLFEAIVVRTSNSEKKLSRLKNNYREKYLKKGYHVKLLTD